MESHLTTPMSRRCNIAPPAQNSEADIVSSDYADEQALQPFLPSQRNTRLDVGARRTGGVVLPSWAGRSFLVGRAGCLVLNGVYGRFGPARQAHFA